MRRPLLLCLALTAGCFPSFQTPELPDADLPDVGTMLPDDALEIPAEEVSAYATCSRAVMSEALVVAATEALRGREDGDVEVRLSDDGCIRFRRSMSGGELVSAEFRIFTGEITQVFRDNTFVFGAFFTRMARWTRDADGTVHGAIDADDDRAERGDDFAEVEVTTRDGYYRVVGHNPASRQVEWRMTQDRSGLPTQTTEALVDGTLRVIDTTVLGPENEACGDGLSISECIGMSRSCTPAQVAVLDEAMARALARGVTCMATGNGETETETWQRLQAMMRLWTMRHDWACMPPSCGCAHWTDGFEESAGQNDRIEVGFEQWSSLSTQRQLGTLFHELMHGVVGAHLDVVINGELPAGRQGMLMRRYVDRVDACEAFCFADQPTACACATCLDRRACDEPCAGLAGCIEYGPTPDGSGTMAIMSRAVGAACVTMTDVDGHAEETASWHVTMAQCQAACPAMGGTCRSYNRSCDPGCE